MIPITTPSGKSFKVWTKRIGNNPALRLHCTVAPVGRMTALSVLTAFSQRRVSSTTTTTNWDRVAGTTRPTPISGNLARYVEEVEQVRTALNLGPENFILLGQSWGGILAMEYALKYGEQLKGLVISNMMSSVPAYNRYAADVLMPAMNQDDLTEIRAIEAVRDFANPRYQELLIRSYYVDHVLRARPGEWPEPVRFSFQQMNHDLYLMMQGPSELGIAEEATLARWDRTNDLQYISTPTLVIGGRHDTMDPRFLEMMATRIPRGSSHICENGSHMAMYDDQESYFGALLGFLSSL